MCLTRPCSLGIRVFGCSGGGGTNLDVIICIWYLIVSRATEKRQMLPIPCLYLTHCHVLLACVVFFPTPPPSSWSCVCVCLCVIVVMCHTKSVWWFCRIPLFSLPLRQADFIRLFLYCRIFSNWIRCALSKKLKPLNKSTQTYRNNEQDEETRRQPTINILYLSMLDLDNVPTFQLAYIILFIVYRI